jgi:hypothetical protein
MSWPSPGFACMLVPRHDSWQRNRVIAVSIPNPAGPAQAWLCWYAGMTTDPSTYWVLACACAGCAESAYTGTSMHRHTQALASAGTGLWSMHRRVVPSTLDDVGQVLGPIPPNPVKNAWFAQVWTTLPPDVARACADCAEAECTLHRPWKDTEERIHCSVPEYYTYKHIYSIDSAERIHCACMHVLRPKTPRAAADSPPEDCTPPTALQHIWFHLVPHGLPYISKPSLLDSSIEPTPESTLLRFKLLPAAYWWPQGRVAKLSPIWFNVVTQNLSQRFPHLKLAAT